MSVYCRSLLSMTKQTVELGRSLARISLRSFATEFALESDDGKNGEGTSVAKLMTVRMVRI